jgi:hypothetical protein
LIIAQPTGNAKRLAKSRVGFVPPLHTLE